MASAQLLPFPAPGNGAASPPTRQPNSAIRPHEHLTPAEIDKLTSTALAVVAAAHSVTPPRSCWRTPTGCEFPSSWLEGSANLHVS